MFWKCFAFYFTRNHVQYICKKCFTLKCLQHFQQECALPENGRWTYTLREIKHEQNVSAVADRQWLIRLVQKKTFFLDKPYKPLAVGDS